MVNAFPIFRARFALLVGFCLMMGGLPVSTRAEQTEVTVFAAASLGDVLTSISSVWDGKVRISPGGSGTIARQVALGAPADVVILADPVWMDWLADQGAILNQSRISPATNSLAIIAPRGAEPLGNFDAKGIEQRLGAQGRIAMGDPASVPAGRYAQEWLRKRDLWPLLEPRIAATDNVRSALAFVVRGETPLGIVYRSDVHAFRDQVEEAYGIPADEQPDIFYSAAAITEQGIDFIEFMNTDISQRIFVEHGFGQGQDN